MNRTVTIPITTRNSVMGKTLLVLVIGCLMGRYYVLDTAADAEKARHLTFEQYSADYERYKAKLTRSSMPPLAGVACMSAFVAGLFGLYELLGWGLGFVVGALLPARKAVFEEPEWLPASGVATGEAGAEGLGADAGLPPA